MVNGIDSANELPMAISSAENLFSPNHPWWSVVNVFGFDQVGGYGGKPWPNWPPHRNFFTLGDSYAAGIGASCGWVYKDDPKPNGGCLKCQGAYGYQLSAKWPPFADREFKFFACSGGTTGAVQDPSTEDGFKSQVQQMKEWGKFQDFGFSTLSIGGVKCPLLHAVVMS